MCVCAWVGWGKWGLGLEVKGRERNGTIRISNRDTIQPASSGKYWGWNWNRVCVCVRLLSGADCSSVI